MKSAWFTLSTSAGLRPSKTPCPMNCAAHEATFNRTRSVLASESKAQLPTPVPGLFIHPFHPRTYMHAQRQLPGLHVHTGALPVQRQRNVHSPQPVDMAGGEVRRRAQGGL